MTSLPSFIELMESLGLERTSHSPSPELSPSPSPESSPSSSPQLGGTTAPSPSRSRSSPSLRDLSSRHRAARYSPYSSYTRRGSSSSSSSTSPPPASLRARRSRSQLTVNVYGSTSDLPAYTPISSYLRRKTPGASPTSPTFPRHVTYESVDITLPIIPSFPNSASTDSSFPKTPQSDITSSPRLSDMAKIVTETTEVKSTRSHRKWHTGVRISTPPYSTGIDDFNRRRLVPHFV
ncbi:hypothetical protein AN958_10210 [Leucoagaricus sp. SymC.cos]|nr:hypothetical protein AN958_10210 [Leucoagaricus sp. SymC.cos]